MHDSTHPLPELAQLQALLGRAAPGLRAQTLTTVHTDGLDFPVQAIELGSLAREAPAVGFFAGIHGVERIGSQVLLAFLHSLVERLHWDEALHRMLEQVRLVFMPVVNPGGMWRQTRATPAGVDLMRNAPVEAEGRVLPLLGGQRLTPRLPWYRGSAQVLEPEALALAQLARTRLLTQPFSLSVDCHSGFGLMDRLWFPHAYTRRPIDCLPELYALRTLFRRTHPHHRLYVIEPQSRHYTTHGDLWDWLYLQRPGGSPPFLPLTLELGSWLWLKKNPRQLFQLPGFFNPILPHRQQRVLRRHLVLFDFLIHAAISWRRWLPPQAARQSLMQEACRYWGMPQPNGGP